MRTFIQLICVLGFAACSASAPNIDSKSKTPKDSSNKLSARPESGVFNVQHKGAKYEVALETAETQAFQSLSSQETAFVVDAANEAIVSDRLAIFAEFYAKVRPQYTNNGEQVLLKGSNFTYQIDRKILNNGKTSYQVNCSAVGAAAGDVNEAAKATLNSKNLASFLQNGSLELSYLYL